MANCIQITFNYVDANNRENTVTITSDPVSPNLNINDESLLTRVLESIYNNPDHPQHNELLKVVDSATSISYREVAEESIAALPGVEMGQNPEGSDAIQYTPDQVKAYTLDQYKNFIREDFVNRGDESQLSLLNLKSKILNELIKFRDENPVRNTMILVHDGGIDIENRKLTNVLGSAHVRNYYDEAGDKLFLPSDSFGENTNALLNLFLKQKGYDGTVESIAETKDGFDFKGTGLDFSLLRPFMEVITKAKPKAQDKAPGQQLNIFPQLSTTPEFDKLPFKSNTPTFTYAGIGSREKTPSEIISLMTALAEELKGRGYTLRTGDADGADKAFRQGATGAMQVFSARDANDTTRKIAREIHPNPRALDQSRNPNYVWNLMARNTNQIFGENLDTPVDFVIAWTQDGLTDYRNRSIKSGGTGQAIDMASRKGIPVINMFNSNWREQLDRVLSRESTTQVQPQSNSYYSKLGNKTKSNFSGVPGAGVQIVNNPNQYLNEQARGEAVVAYRNSRNPQQSFGNPFTDTVNRSTEQNVEDFISWLTFGDANSPSIVDLPVSVQSVLNDTNMSKRRNWIREQIKSGRFKGKPIYYGNTKAAKEGVPSHATALDWLINAPDSPFNSGTSMVSTPASTQSTDNYSTLSVNQLKDKLKNNPQDIAQMAIFFAGDNKAPGKISKRSFTDWLGANGDPQDFSQFLSDTLPEWSATDPEAKKHFQFLFDYARNEKVDGKRRSPVQVRKDMLISVLREVENSVQSGNKEVLGQPTISPSVKINIYAGSGENADLSNFAIRPFEYNTGIFPRETVNFQSVEQAFQFMKLESSMSSVRNESIASRILDTTNGAELRKLGRQFEKFNTEEWDRNSSRIMKELLLNSFRQNPIALSRLLSTGNATLTHTQDKSKWGREFPKLLMEVRQELSEQSSTTSDATTYPNTEAPLPSDAVQARFDTISLRERDYDNGIFFQDELEEAAIYQKVRKVYYNNGNFTTNDFAVAQQTYQKAVNYFSAARVRKPYLLPNGKYSVYVKAADISDLTQREAKEERMKIQAILDGRDYDIKWNMKSEMEKAVEDLERYNRETSLPSSQTNTTRRQDLNIRSKYFPSNNTVSAGSILNKIAESNHPLNVVAQQLSSYLVNNVPVTLDPVDYYTNPVAGGAFAIEGVRAMGYYSPSANEIRIAEFSPFGNKGSESALIHEVIHAMTNRYIYNNPNDQTVKDFQTVYQHAVDNLPNASIYALSNIDEFIVGLFTDSRLISDLKGIAPTKVSREYKNLFEEVFDYILSLFGFNKSVDAQLYEQAFAIATNIIADASAQQDTMESEYEFDPSSMEGFMNDTQSVITAEAGLYGDPNDSYKPSATFPIKPLGVAPSMVLDTSEQARQNPINENPNTGRRFKNLQRNLRTKLPLSVEVMSSSEINAEFSKGSHYRLGDKLAFVSGDSIILNADKSPFEYKIRNLVSLPLNLAKLNNKTVYFNLTDRAATHPAFRFLRFKYPQLDDNTLREEMIGTILSDIYNGYTLGREDSAWVDNNQEFLEQLLNLQKQTYADLLGLDSHRFFDLTGFEFYNLTLNEIIDQFQTNHGLMDIANFTELQHIKEKGLTDGEYHNNELHSSLVSNGVDVDVATDIWARTKTKQFNSWASEGPELSINPDGTPILYYRGNLPSELHETDVTGNNDMVFAKGVFTDSNGQLKAANFNIKSVWLADAVKQKPFTFTVDDYANSKGIALVGDDSTLTKSIKKLKTIFPNYEFTINSFGDVSFIQFYNKPPQEIIDFRNQLLQDNTITKSC